MKESSPSTGSSITTTTTTITTATATNTTTVNRLKRSSSSVGGVASTIPVNRLKSSSSTVCGSNTIPVADEHPHGSSSSSSSSSKKEKAKPCCGEPIDPQVLLLIRLLFLFYFGCMGAVVPYLSVYYHTIGHSGPIIGLLSAISPLTTFVVGPIWGIVSDQSSNPVTVLQVALVVSVVGKLSVAASDAALYVACMVFLTSLFSAPIKALMDAMILSRIPDKSLYGRLRLFGQVGFSLGTFVMGYLLTAREKGVCSTPGQNSLCYSLVSWLFRSLPASLQSVVAEASFWFEHRMSGYRFIFVVHAVLAVPAWLCIRALDRMEQSGNNNNNNKRRRRRARRKKQKLLKEEDDDVDHTTNNTEDENDCEKPKIIATPLSGSLAMSSSTADMMKTTSKSTTTTTTSKAKVNFRTGFLSLLVQNPNARLFFVLVFVAGLNAGVNETFGNVRIREMGGSPQQMGFFRLLGAAGGAPMFWFSGSVDHWLGGGSSDPVILFFLVVYMLRFATLGSMTNADYAAPGEFMRGAAYAAFMASSTVYAHKISPEGMNATLLQLVHGLYAGLGQSIGAVISGWLQEMVGTACTFHIVAFFDFIMIGWAMVYLYVYRESRRLANTSITTTTSMIANHNNNNVMAASLPSTDEKTKKNKI